MYSLIVLESACSFESRGDADFVTPPWGSNALDLLSEWGVPWVRATEIDGVAVVSLYLFEFVDLRADITPSWLLLSFEFHEFTREF